MSSSKQIKAILGSNIVPGLEAFTSFAWGRNYKTMDMEGSIYCDEVHGAKMVSRAQRFSMQAIMHYRIIGENRWYVGTVENMSSTGVLFRGERIVDVDSSIEVTVNVPGSLAAGHSSKMVSRGKIVRVSPSESGQDTRLMAAALFRLRILRD